MNVAARLREARAQSDCAAAGPSVDEPAAYPAPAERRAHVAPNRIAEFSNLAAGLCVLFGALVDAAWHAGARWLVQWEPGVTPVAYTTGLCLVLLGAGLLALNQGRRVLAQALCAPAAAIAVLTLAICLGAPAPWSAADAAWEVLRTMAPNTALACVLLAGGIMAPALRLRRAGSVTALLGTLAASLGAAGLCGYAARLPFAYTWGRVGSMAPQTAVAMMVLGAGLVASAWASRHARQHERRRAIPHWLPQVALIGASTFTLALWQAVRLTHQRPLLAALVLIFGAAGGLLLFVTLRLGLKASLDAEAIGRLNANLQSEVRRVRKAEEGARAASLYARGLLEASLDPLVTIRNDGTIMDVNRATEQATGVGRERLIGSDFCSYFTDPEEARRGYRQVFENGRVQDYALAIRHAGGGVTEVLYNASLFRNPAGEVEGVFAAARDITRRKRAEEELRISQERLALALQAANAGNFDWDMQTNVNVWTRETEELYGVPAGQFGGTFRAWEELVLPEDLPGAKAGIAEALKSGEYTCEWRIRRPVDGQVRWVAARAKILRDEAGRPWRMIGINFDITERKQVEEEMRKHAMLLDLAHDAIMVSDLECRILFWSRGAETTYGWSAAEAQGQVTRELLRTRFPENFGTLLGRLQENGQWEGELQHRTRDGREIVVASRWSLQRDAQGAPAAILEINRDVTERKRVEAELRKLNRSLKTLSDSNAAILHATSDYEVQQQLCEILVREGGYRLAWVGRAEESAGKPVVPAAMAGAHTGYVPTLQVSWDEDSAWGRGPTGSAIRSGRAQVCPDVLAGEAMAPWRELALHNGFRSSAAFPLRHAERVFGAVSIYAAELNAFGSEEVALLQELADNVAFGMAALRTQAEREQMRQALQERTRDLETVNKELETFAYSVSHDLRAPLRSIDGFSQVLLEDYGERLDNEGKDCLRRVRAGCQNMGQLIDAILQLSRVTRSEVRPERVDLSMLALAEAAMLQRAGPERKVEFHIASGLEAQTDRKLLQVALQNLMENAWKFTACQPQARIEVGGLDEPAGRVFFVRDNGAGFDMKYAAKLFQPFQRLHGQEDFQGTGIGLATVQRIMQRLGGKIWAEASPGQGAAFYFRLK